MLNKLLVIAMAVMAANTLASAQAAVGVAVSAGLLLASTGGEVTDRQHLLGVMLSTATALVTLGYLFPAYQTLQYILQAFAGALVVWAVCKLWPLDR